MEIEEWLVSVYMYINFTNVPLYSYRREPRECICHRLFFFLFLLHAARRAPVPNLKVPTKVTLPGSSVPYGTRHEVQQGGHIHLCGHLSL